MIAGRVRVACEHQLWPFVGRYSLPGSARTSREAVGRDTDLLIGSSQEIVQQKQWMQSSVSQLGPQAPTRLGQCLPTPWPICALDQNTDFAPTASNAAAKVVLLFFIGRKPGADFQCC